MNTLKSLFKVIFLLTATAFAFLFAARILGLVSLELFGLPLWMTEQLQTFIGSDWQTRLVLGGIFFSVFVLGAVFLYAKLRPFLFGEPRILISQDELGKVEIAESCLIKLVAYEAVRLDNKSIASTRVFKKGNGLHLKSKITVKNKKEVKEFEKQLKTNIMRVLESNLGIVAESLQLKLRSKLDFITLTLSTTFF